MYSFAAELASSYLDRELTMKISLAFKKRKILHGNQLNVFNLMF
jgi:hypothetical protein